MPLKKLRATLRAAPVVPVLTVEREADAAPLASALREGGIEAVEVTLRTPAALAILSEMKHAEPELWVGAGTILSDGDIDAALKAGADFLVTPGVSPALAAALLDSGAPSIPGVGTASEAMTRYEEGFPLLKFFPAAAAGGVDFLKGLSGPLPHLEFMPTGGIGPANAGAYLALPNVAAIGGSWLATPDDIAKADWAGVAEKARQALSLALQEAKRTA